MSTTATDRRPRSRPPASRQRAEGRRGKAEQLARGLDWIKTPRRRQSLVARVTAWQTRDGRYRVELHRYEVSMPPAWFALVADGDAYRILSRHRTKAAALRSCSQHFARDARGR